MEGTPLHTWFKASLSSGTANPGLELQVNSYHHQGVKRLAPRFKAMAFSPDGLVEAFYDPHCMDPEQGKFIVGLQFHPERMRRRQDGTVGQEAAEGGAVGETFDYPECPRVYMEFAKAVMAYQRRLRKVELEGKEVEWLDEGLQQQQQEMVKSFSLARKVYEQQHRRKSPSGQDFKVDEVFKREGASSLQELALGAEFLEEATPLAASQVRRLKAMGATVRNSSLALRELHTEVNTSSGNGKRSSYVIHDMEGWSREELEKALAFHSQMVNTVRELLARKHD